MTFLDRLQQLNFQLPTVSNPGSHYAPVNIRVTFASALTIRLPSYQFVP